MENVAEFMGKDHDRLDSIFRDFQNIKRKDYENAKSLYKEFKTGLQRHIVWEEDILFPLFEEKTGSCDQGPTAVMRMEHRQIKEFLEKIHDSIVLNRDIGTDNLEAGLLEVLSLHNEKEENILYPWIDDALDKSEIEEVFNKIRSLPEERYNKCCE